MGVDIHVKIIYKDEYGWKPVSLFYQNEKNEMKEINPYPFRNHEVFSILSGKEEDYFPYTSIFKKDLPQSVLNEINVDKTLGCYDFHEVNLADLESYTLKHPMVKDYDAEWEDDKPIYKTNPMIGFMNRMKSYVDFAIPDWNWDHILSKVRILYWFDC